MIMIVKKIHNCCFYQKFIIKSCGYICKKSREKNISYRVKERKLYFGKQIHVLALKRSYLKKIKISIQQIFSKNQKMKKKNIYIY